MFLILHVQKSSLKSFAIPEIDKKMMDGDLVGDDFSIIRCVEALLLDQES